MTSINQNIDTISAELIDRWTLPHPQFSSGKDLRSSDQGIFELFYGAMEQAARYEWQNGGRTLVDKTYLAILWATQELETPCIGFERLASNLDQFIRHNIVERWEELSELDHEARHQLAIEWVQAASGQLFGSQRNDSQATSILMFLCPQLPIFLYSDNHRQSVQALLPQQPIDSYADYHQACRQLLALNLPFICAAPTPTTAANQPNLCSLLSQTDWWPRRLLAQQIRSQAA